MEWAVGEERANQLHTRVNLNPRNKGTQRVLSRQYMTSLTSLFLLEQSSFGTSDAAGDGICAYVLCRSFPLLA